MTEERRSPSQRLDAVEKNTARIDGKVDVVIERLDHLGLNGDAEAIREIARHLPEIRKLVDLVPILAAIAKEKAETVAFWAVVRRITFWDRGGKKVWGVLFAAAAAGFFGALFLHYLPSVSVSRP